MVPEIIRAWNCILEQEVWRSAAPRQVHVFSSVRALGHLLHVPLGPPS